METLDCDAPNAPAVLCDAELLGDPLASARRIPSASSVLGASPLLPCLLIIGAGKTAESMATRLARAQGYRLIVANRTRVNAQFLADRLGGIAVSLEDLPDHLAEADMVVSCTASDQPILSRALVEEAVRLRQHKPMFLVDVAERGDFEATVRSVQDVFFATWADLDFHASSSMPDEESASVQVQSILEWQLHRHQAWRNELNSHASLERLKSSAAEYRDRIFIKACQLLKAGRPAHEALEFLAHTLTNKFMHAPSASLRAASLRGDVALMQAAERLFESVGEDA